MKFSKKVYEEELKNGKNVAKEVVNTEGVKATDSTDDLMTKLKKLAELKDAGVLSEEEFLQMKTKLISQF
jgi:Short C-terminal domain